MALAIPAAPLLHGAATPATATPAATAAPSAPATTSSDISAMPIKYMATIPQAQAMRSLPSAHTANANALAVSNLLYGGGPVMVVPHAVLVFWGFHTTGVAAVDDPSFVEPYLTSFFSKIGGSYWTGIQDQYYGIGGTHITNPAVQFTAPTDVIHVDPPGGLPAVIPDALLATVARTAAEQYWAAHGFNANDQFIVATPHDRNTAEFGAVYCAYHSTTVSTTYGVFVSYTNLPYMPDMPLTCGANFAGGGTLDGVSIVAGHEYEETVTDPQPSTGWVDSAGQENGDKCAWLTSGPGHTQLVNFGGTNFAVQGLWSNAISNCDV